jgi:hypothetical protein
MSMLEPTRAFPRDTLFADIRRIRTTVTPSPASWAARITLTDVSLCALIVERLTYVTGPLACAFSFGAWTIRTAWAEVCTICHAPCFPSNGKIWIISLRVMCMIIGADLAAWECLSGCRPQVVVYRHHHLGSVSSPLAT